MSYQPETILRRKEPFPEGDDNAPYNEIRVIGPSPVETQQTRSAEWEGQEGNNFSVQPTSFGATIDLPYGELHRDYVVEREPEPRKITRGEVEEFKPGPTPEERFKEIEEEREVVREEARAAAPDTSPEERFATEELPRPDPDAPPLAE